MPSTPYAKAPYAEVSSASSIPSTHSSTSMHRVEGEGVLAQTNTRQRIECRRVKKQRMERVRRARISDKIAQLHGLALSIVGVDAETDVRAEKVEMLGLCHEVLHSVKRMLVADPDMLQRLRAFHRDSVVTNGVCQSITCDCSITSQLGCRNRGVAASLVSESSSSLFLEGNDADRTGCRLPLKKREEVWRPYV